MAREIIFFFQLGRLVLCVHHAQLRSRPTPHGFSTGGQVAHARGLGSAWSPAPAPQPSREGLALLLPFLGCQEPLRPSNFAPRLTGGAGSTPTPPRAGKQGGSYLRKGFQERTGPRTIPARTASSRVLATRIPIPARRRPARPPASGTRRRAGQQGGARRRDTSQGGSGTTLTTLLGTLPIRSRPLGLSRDSKRWRGPLGCVAVAGAQGPAAG
ncbi:uncharacterized protein LOC129623003 [Bubalus kerabau]|uniref:uncharacterized protein LOC129623003 n=1 Tax=Bubalus carabanensis TaxID=3119969 RepID=UPI00244E995A|nr:uncharacterized protein LOC129623003 [Bubalus carabanensis]XP_055395959.1 uncharacterized protein LOC129623003 [Bubalus carabanensis]